MSWDGQCTRLATVTVAEGRPARRYKVFAVHLAVTMIMAGILLYFVDWRASFAVLTEIRGRSAALAFLVLLAGVVVSAVKWQLLLRATDISAPFSLLVRSYLIGQFFSSFLPSTVGGDIARFQLTRHLGQPSRILASIVAERFSGLFTLLLLASLALIAEPELPREFLEHTAAVAGFIALVLGTLVMAELVRPGRLPFFQALRRHPLGARWLLSASRMHAQLVTFGRRPALCAACLVLSVVFYVLLGAFQYATIRALGLEVALLDIARITPLIAVISALPISVNGLGVAEAAFVFLYSHAGLTPSQAFAAALARRLLILAMALLGGIVLPFAWTRRSVAKVSREEADP